MYTEIGLPHYPNTMGDRGTQNGHGLLEPCRKKRCLSTKAYEQEFRESRTPSDNSNLIAGTQGGSQAAQLGCVSVEDENLCVDCQNLNLEQLIRAFTRSWTGLGKSPYPWTDCSWSEAALDVGLRYSSRDTSACGMCRLLCRSRMTPVDCSRINISASTYSDDNANTSPEESSENSFGDRIHSDNEGDAIRALSFLDTVNLFDKSTGIRVHMSDAVFLVLGPKSILMNKDANIFEYVKSNGGVVVLSSYDENGMFLPRPISRRFDPELARLWLKCCE